MSYFYDEDVQFKGEFYSDHEGCIQGHEMVKNLMKNPSFKQMYGSALFANQGIGKRIGSNSMIHRVDRKKISPSLLTKLELIGR